MVVCVGESVQASELDERFGVILDPDVDQRFRPRLGLLGAYDEQPRGLTAAEVAAGRFGRIERRE